MKQTDLDRLCVCSRIPGLSDVPALGDALAANIADAPLRPRFEDRRNQLPHCPPVYSPTFARCGIVITPRRNPNNERAYFNVPFAYELNRKAFRLERPQFGNAALNNSLRVPQ